MGLISRMRSIMILAVLTGSFLLGKPTYLQAAPPPPEKPDLNLLATTAQQAIAEAVSMQSARSLGFMIYDTQVESVKVAQDGQWGTGLLVAYDPQTGQLIPTEPGLAITRQSGDSWEVYFPGDDAWQAALPGLPDDVLNPGVREQLLLMDQIQETTAPTAPLTGYRLPWEAGKTAYVSQTVAHDRYTASGNAHFSFDFYIPQTMFNLYAAKAGTVWSYRDDVPNGDASAGNYIVLEDRTTVPTTYQLYLHLAQDSIPPDLKVVGAPVQRGQYLGIADDTGVSTGHHLHYQVQTMSGYSAYWGVSVDITFEDVEINGGRPRITIDLPYCKATDVCTEFQNSYISGNTVSGDRTPPFGDFTNLTNGVQLTSPTLTLEGWASDTESELNSIQVIGNYDGTWQPLSPNLSTSPFNTILDLCSLGLPEGPLSLALRLRDSTGNVSLDLPGLRHVINAASCPSQPPACMPEYNEVALYSEPGFRGECQVFDTGEYSGSSSLREVGVKNTASIQVGSSVLATLYSEENYLQRNETFLSSDRNLSDNRIGDSQVASLKVMAHNQMPEVPQPVWPASGSIYTSDRNIPLSWRDEGGGIRYRARVKDSTGIVIQESGWLSEPFWQLNGLADGNYSWQAQAGNSNGESSWSENFPLTIQSSGLPTPATRTTPYTNNIENGASTDWQHSNYWDTALVAGNPNGGETSWVYDVNYPDSFSSGEPNSGELTSPRITIPANGSYSLRFWYRYATESQGIDWDQRWVQISNGGPFTNIYQLSADQPNRWLESPAIALDAYAGQTIRVRFYFATLDAQLNDFEGWTIDDLTVTSSAPVACADQDNALLNYGQQFSSVLCPAGDSDLVQFQGQAGDRIGILAQASPLSSPVDTVLYLLDTDGKSILAENDDIIYAQNTDSFISYRLPVSGTYFLKLKDWAHPSAGGPEYTYKLTLTRDSDQPQVSLVSLANDTYLPPTPFQIEVNASDPTSGVQQVDFYLHEGNWVSGAWVHLGADSDGSDGWSWELDPGDYLDQTGMAVYARAQDWAGNAAYAATWGLALDRTAPQTQLSALANTIPETAIVLDWTAADNLSGVDSFDLQVRTANQSWQTFASSIPADRRRAVYIGESGKTYEFRMRGSDRLGNTEAYPTNPEATTSISSSICARPDSWETARRYTSDNQAGKATMVSTSFAEQVHNLCNPLDSDHLGDEDWLQIEMQAGLQLIANAEPQHPGAAIVLELYASDGVTLLAQGNPQDFGQSTILLWRAPQNQRVYLRMRHLYAGVAGEGIKYTIRVTQGEAIFFPILRK